MTSSALEPWTGPTETVEQAEGNELFPDTAYRGNWADTTYYSFDFELTGMVALQITAKDDRGSAEHLDIKLFSNYVELYSTVGVMPHDGEYAFRLPAGTYNLSLQLAPGVEANETAPWNLRIMGIEGTEALTVPVPEQVLAMHSPRFQGNVLNLKGLLGDDATFVDLMKAWLYISVPDYGSYVKPGTLLRPPGTDLAALFAGTAPGMELMDHEPVVVYELVDLFAARVVTADGLYGLVHVDDLEPSRPADPQLPDTFRVAEGFRLLAPDTAPPDRNGGMQVLLNKAQTSKDLKKVKKCLAGVEDRMQEEGFDLASLRLQVMAVTPSDPGYDSILGMYLEAKNAHDTYQDECLAEAWMSFGQFITDEERVLAAFDVLASIRQQFGVEMTEVPTEPPPILPSLVPPPPPPPPPPAPEPPAPAVVTEAPPAAATAPPPPPAPEKPKYQAPPGGFTFDEPSPPAAATEPAPPPEQPPPEQPPPKQPPPPPAEEPSPAPPEWQPIIPWAHVDGES